MEVCLTSCSSTPRDKFGASDVQWFKITEADNRSGGQFQRDQMDQKSRSVELPSTLANDEYLLHHEIIDQEAPSSIPPASRSKTTTPASSSTLSVTLPTNSPVPLLLSSDSRFLKKRQLTPTTTVPRLMTPTKTSVLLPLPPLKFLPALLARQVARCRLLYSCPGFFPR